MRKILFGTAAVLLAAGCSDGGGTEASVATSVAVSAASPTLNALGATTVVHATVSDQKGKALRDAPITWTSSSAAVSVVGAGGDSAVVTAVSNGTAIVMATSGAAAGSASVQVAQAAASVLKVGGDQETGQVGAVLGSQVRVQVRDRLNAPVAGMSVGFAVTGGGGSITPPTAITDANGIAAATWTLGAAAGTNTVQATFQGSSIAPVTFTAQGSTTVTTAINVVAGNNQAAMVNTNVPVAPSVIVTTAGGTALAGRTVNFAVRSGGGTVTGGTAVTNAAGIATAASWKMGPVGGPNELAVTVEGVTGQTAVIQSVGCEGPTPGTAGYGITLCFTSAMTASQAQVFRNSAARWAQVIKGDLPDVQINVPANACNDGTPSSTFGFDDLVIYATIEAIDGVGKVLGQAGACGRRNENTGNGSGLAFLGLMRFDEADVAALERDGLLGSVLLHEMGHVIGISSTVWTAKGLLQSPSSASSVLDTYYSGGGGAVGFNNIGGTAYTGGQKVPVENTGGAGTANSHWRETVLKNELMTGYLNVGTNPLSELTARALADIGYAVDVSAADNFFLAMALQSSPSGPSASLSSRSVKMHNDELVLPQFTVDRQGRMIRLPAAQR
ncbi:MAG TPA: Ig-like domain-containing protein [Longimicrobium sp.]|jgi:hypothetical protein|uniref:Ig-like domain-containing protein n=1 Tax=Longimicrobium sp. TaxID=2029185 RepID=UPI002EDB8C6B